MTVASLLWTLQPGSVQVLPLALALWPARPREDFHSLPGAPFRVCRVPDTAALEPSGGCAFSPVSGIGFYFSFEQGPAVYPGLPLDSGQSCLSLTVLGCQAGTVRAASLSTSALAAPVPSLLLSLTFSSGEVCCLPDSR